MQVDLHYHPEVGIEAVFGLGVTEGSHPWADLLWGQDLEPEVLVQGSIPGDVPEGRECERRESFSDGPFLRLVDQRSAHPLTLMIRLHTDLLDVAGVIDHVNQDVADGLTGLVDGYPGATVTCVAAQDFYRRRLVVSNLAEPELSIALTSRPLNVPKFG